MDVLSEIFETVQMRGSIYFRTDFSPPWGTTVPDFRKATRFHFVVAGDCWLKVGEAAPIALKTGDFALIPGGAAHALSSHPDGETPPLEQVLAEAGYDGRGHLRVGKHNPDASTQLVCGHFSFSDGADHPVLRALPAHLVISRAARIAHPWFDQTLALLTANVFRSAELPVAVIQRLSEVVLIEALHAARDQAPALAKLIAAFADPRIGAAVTAIHNDPGKPWTVETLAQTACMSRARFAARFHDLIGMAPIAYLTEWRLQRALAMVSGTGLAIAEIGYRCGYASGAAFSRAFTQRFGSSPIAWRERA